MEAKLIKTVTDNYILVDATKEFHGEGYLLGTTTVSDAPRLSLKNCQAIERGYDLDELAGEFTKDESYGELSGDLYKGYIFGFQKAVKLNSTKLFTLEDMMNCWNKALKFQDHKETLGEHIQSLQQTEWEVEVEKENVMHDYNGNISLGAKFKLDADGCLILKLKSE